MATVRLDALEKRYDTTAAVAGVTLDIADGEFLTLLGPSGCGKTTTLRMIAGFIAPSAGRVWIGANDVTTQPPQHRDVNMVFQDYALFPHLTVAENIAFGLVERRAPRAERARRVAELLELVRLPGHEARYPSELSGGQQQRVAFARAIAHPPRVLLMDEPLGALDLKLREAMQEELRRLQRQLGITTVYVTHDQVEAMRMSDRIAVMNQGRVEQLGTPEAIYERPATEFAAGFVGSINFLKGRCVGHEDGCYIVETAAGRLRADTGAARIAGATPVTLAVRPEHLRLDTAAGADGRENRVDGQVAASSFLGNLVQLVVRAAGDLELRVELRAGDRRPPDGATVSVSWPTAKTVLLPSR
ncbi:MAG: ABC transporter ATP-binding protein [Proteobacteria bacterium]|nr:ABC transporter ATP-binding protein [Pseudomonadota bacterium]